MKAIIDYLKTLIDTTNPNSSSRFLALVTIGTVLYAWLLLSIYNRALSDIPIGVYTFVGIVVTGGVIKRFAEPIGRPDPGQRDSESETKDKEK